MLSPIAEILFDRRNDRRWDAPANWSKTAYRDRKRAEKAAWMAKMGYW